MRLLAAAMLAAGTIAAPARADTVCAICRPAADGDLAAIEVKVARGADINALDDGESALTYALENGRWDVALWLLDHGARLIGRESQQAFLALAVLSNAIKNDQPMVVQALINAHIEVDKPFIGESAYAKGQTALIFACSLAHNDARDLAISLLLGAGADPNHADSEGRNAVDHAFDNLDLADPRQMNALRMLLAAGGRPNTTHTFVLAADSATSGHPDAWRLLFAYGVQLIDYSAEARQSLPTILALADQDLLRQLVDSGVEIDIATPIAPPLANDPKQIDPQGNEGMTALAFAVRAGDVEKVHALLQLGADPDVGSVEHGTETFDARMPMKLALARGDPRIVALLLDFGGDMSQWMPASRDAITASGSSTDAQLVADLQKLFFDASTFDQGLRDRIAWPAADPTGDAPSVFPTLAKGSLTLDDYSRFRAGSAFASGTRTQQQVDRALASGLDHLPDPSPQAQHHAALAAALAARAKRQSDFVKAALQFEAALRLAPWMDDWRRDACIVDGLAAISRAQFNCGLYAEIYPDDEEITDIYQKYFGS